jgi:hypothetical protein
MGRFLAPMAPFLAVLVASAWRAHASERFRRVSLALLSAGAAVALSLLTLSGVFLFPRSLLQRFHFRLGNPKVESEYEMWRGMKLRADSWVGHGKVLALVTRPGESMILGPIGAVGYYSELTLYDTYGLTDRHVATDVAPSASSPGHDMAVPPRYFFPRRPTYLGYRVYPRGKPPDKEAIPEFRAYEDLYEIEKHPMPRGLDVWLLRLKW